MFGQTWLDLGQSYSKNVQIVIAMSTSLIIGATFLVSPVITRTPDQNDLKLKYCTQYVTSQWKAELFFQGRAIQDGHLSATFIWNPYFMGFKVMDPYDMGP